NLPDIPGIADFAGTLVHTGLWPREGVDLDGKRVGIIGTGSSGMQAIPHLARAASHLTVFQRTPNYSFAGEVEPIDPELQDYVKAHYRELRDMQRTSGAGISGMTMPTAGGGTRAVGAGVFSGLNSARGVVIDPEQLHALLAMMEEGFGNMVRQRVRDPEIAEA